MIRNKKQEPKKQTYLNKHFFEWIIFLFLFFLPTQLGKHFFLPFSYISGLRVDYLAPAIFATDLLAFILIALNIKTVLKFFTNKKILIALCLFLINIIFAQSWQIAAYRFIKIIELIAIFSIFLNLKNHRKIIFFGFFSGAIFQSFLVLLQFINKKSLQGIFYFFGERYINLSLPDIAKASLNGVEILRPYGTFSHPNSLAGFYLLLYTFLLFSKEFGENKLLKNLFLSLCFLLILFSFSKTAIVIFVLINIFYVLRKIKESACIICDFSKLLIPLFLGVVFISARGDPLSFAKRLSLNNQAWSLIMMYPFFGAGLGNFLIAEGSKISYLFYTPQPVHNIFLLFIAEVGVIAATVIFYLLITSFSERKNILFIMVCMTIILTGMLDHYWLTLQQNFLLMGVLLALSRSRRVLS